LSGPALGKLSADVLSPCVYAMIQAFVLSAGTSFVLINLVVDLSYAAIDPRVRLDRGAGTPRSASSRRQARSSRSNPWR